LESRNGYERLKSNSLEIYPSPSKLYRLQAKMISNDGNCPKVYSWFRDERDFECQPKDGAAASERKKCRVQVMCDEANFKSDIYTNVQNGVTSGFAASDGMSTINFAAEVAK
jgi:hypothetical protein